MIRWFLFSLIIFLSPVATPALESDSLVPDSCLLLGKNAAYRKLDINQLQAGIRAFYDNELSRFEDAYNNVEAVRRNLSDGQLGNVTRKAMTDICSQLDPLHFAEPAHEAVELVLEYGWLLNRVPAWPRSQSSAVFLERTKELGPRAWLMLAGRKETTLRHLTETQQIGNNEVCANLNSPFNTLKNTDYKDEIKAGAVAIVKAMRISDADMGLPDALVKACKIVNGQGKPEDIFKELSEYVHIDAPVESGLMRLTDPEFPFWWAAQPAQTARLLFGSTAAVKFLVSSFEPINKQEISACTEQEIELLDQDFTHYRFRSATEEEPEPPPEKNLSEIANQEFRSSRELVDAVVSELGIAVGSCKFGIISRLIARDYNRVRQYSLSKDSIDSLTDDPDTADLAEILNTEPELDALTLQDLELSVMSAVIDKAVKTALVEINKIADQAAQAAKAIPLVNDTSVDRGHSTSAQLETPTAFALTEQSMQELLISIQDSDINDALKATLYSEKSTLDEIRSSVVTLLAEISNRKLTTNSAKVRQWIQTGAVERWVLNDSLIEEIAARPDLANNQPIEPGVLEPLKNALGGISYFNRRLFDKSLLAPINIPKSDYKPSTTDAQRELLISQSRVLVDPKVERSDTALATSCGCGLRRDKHDQVYSIHPFWKWPLKEAADQEGPLLDFAYVDRIAFDGVVMNYAADDPNQAPNITVRHTEHWKTAADTFTKTAHRFEADADLVFRMVGWENWNEENVKNHAREIAQILNSDKSDSIWQLLSPSYSTVPDGVALIFQSPKGYKAIDDPAFKVVVNLFFAELRNLLKQHQQITVGFDISLDPETDSIEIFRVFSAVLLDAENKVEDDKNSGEDEENAKSDKRSNIDIGTIDRVLVFLERPTTDSKKLLYTHILNMTEFRGSNRADLFRKIIPVVPPEAHKELRRLNRNGNAVGVDKDGLFKDTYGQFYDDLVFFDDNFSGIGFWPALYEDTPDPQYTQDIKSLIKIRFNQYFYTSVFDQNKDLDELLDNSLTPVCRYICPNRNVLYTVTIAISFIIVALLIFGLAGRFRQIAGHAVHYGFASIITIDAAILICSKSELRLALILIAITLAIWRVYAITVKPDAPLP